MDNEASIGIFDSGIGGLTVFKEIARAFPAEDLIYLGDTARVPFGTKSPETVLKYTLKNLGFLLEHGVKAAVIACNTASSLGCETIRKHFKDTRVPPILEVITPGAKAALTQTKSKRVGVIGTEGTIRSGAYQKTLQALDSSVQVTAKVCPILVPLAEEGWVGESPFDREVVRMILSYYLGEMKTAQIDTLILGCTHYPLFKRVMAEILGPMVSLVDSAEETARLLGQVLGSASLLRKENRRGIRRFFSTDSPERMKRVGRLFLEGDLDEVEQVDIG